MSKYTKFTRKVFKFCDIITEPFSNWWRRNTKGMFVEKEVRYGEDDLETADIYCKKELMDELKPVLINIHGGGFVGGDKDNRIALCVWYANLGYFVFNINYGLAPESPFPKGPANCIEALNYVVKNAEKYKLDTSRIVLCGDSAGGYMATSVCAACDCEELRECYGQTPLVKPCAIVLNCGIYDLETALKGKMIFNMAPKIALDVCGVPVEDIQNYKYHKYLSIFDYITDKFPKAFIAYSARDFFVPGQGAKMVEKLQNFGIYVDFYVGNRVADIHVFPLFWDLQSAKESNAKLEEFLIKIRDGAPMTREQATENAQPQLAAGS